MIHECLISDLLLGLTGTANMVKQEAFQDGKLSTRSQQDVDDLFTDMRDLNALINNLLPVLRDARKATTAPATIADLGRAIVLVAEQAEKDLHKLCERERATTHEEV